MYGNACVRAGPRLYVCVLRGMLGHDCEAAERSCDLPAVEERQTKEQMTTDEDEDKTEDSQPYYTFLRATTEEQQHSQSNATLLK